MHTHHILAAGHVPHGHLPVSVAHVLAALVIGSVIFAVLAIIAKVLSPRKRKTGTRQSPPYAAPARRR